MVRLRTDRWYSAAGQHRSRGQVAQRNAGPRRLISLCFLLALVIVLMQKAADPSYVRNAFTALGVPLEPAAHAPRPLPEGTAAFAASAETSGQADAASRPPAATASFQAACRDLVPRLLEELAPSQLPKLAESWFAPAGAVAADRPSAVWPEAAPAWLDALADQTRASPLSREAQAAWLEHLQQFADQWQQLREHPYRAELEGQLRPELLRVVSDYLDQQLLAGLRDASPWTSSETTAFWRLLQRSPPAGAAGRLPMVQTQQLLTAPPSQRGVPVRYRGSVRRVEFADRAFSPLGLSGGYWVLWLRGADNAVQPVAVYTRDPQVAQLASSLEAGGDDFPEIEVRGVYAKRLAYASQAGVEVAPTLFAWQVRPLAAPLAETADAAPGAEMGHAGAAAAAETPPWATAGADDPLQSVWADEMQRLLTPAAVAQIEDYVTTRQGAVPDALLQIFHAARRVGWSRAVTLPRPLTLPGEVILRGQTLRGWVRAATPVELTDDQRGWFQAADDERLYRVDMSLGVEPAASQSTQLVSVYCQRVPEVWLLSAQLRQPAEFAAVTLEAPSGPRPLWCALAAAPQWKFPAELSVAQLQPLLEPALSTSHFELGWLGWDLNHLEPAARRHQRPLASEESDGFFSLIRLVAAQPKSPPGELAAETSPLTLLTDAQRHVGRRVQWPVRIVSARVVPVDDPAQQRQLGAERYVQWDGFVDLGEDRIRLKPASDDGAGPPLEFVGEFPITIVSTAELAASPLTAGRLTADHLTAGQTSWEVGQYAQLDGRFYRMWSYDSEMMHARDPRSRQIAPLVIAQRITPVTPALASQTNAVGWFGWALCAATLVILAGILWSAAGAMRPLRRRH